MSKIKKRKSTSRSSSKGGNKMLRWIIFIGVFLALIIVMFLGPNTGSINEKKYFYIHTGDDFSQVVNNLNSEGFLINRFSFNVMARTMGYNKNIKPGKYKIESFMSNLSLLRMLRNGKQVPVKLVINKLRTQSDFIKKVSENLEVDSTELNRLLHADTFLAKYGLDSNTAMTGIIPDSYEFWWNTSAYKTLVRLFEYQKKFWTDDRKAKAKQLGFSEVQIYIIASLVEEETNQAEDKPKIASVYINRVRKGMLLQADPTLKFALGDFTLKRLYDKHKAIVSPYNTYMFKGLPPGPICTPSKRTIDAVLNSPSTNYIFFCARADFSGFSDFSVTYEEHQKYAAAFIKAQNERSIK